MEASRLRIAVIGAGNVASHLARALSRVADVVAVASRNGVSASRLSAELGDGCVSVALESIPSDADLYLIAVSDDAVSEVASSTPDYPGIWAHTSGSVPVDVLAKFKSRSGVFYPLQTFTRDVAVDVSEVPFFIEGNDPRTGEVLMNLARMISRRVEYADSRRRRQLHVAAVFACNFANLMWMEADEILRSGDLDLSYLMPLLKVTVAKLEHTSPRDAMTGPARRGDRGVIEWHRELLHGDQRAIYTLLSDVILRDFGHDAVSDDKSC